MTNVWNDMFRLNFNLISFILGNGERDTKDDSWEKMDLSLNFAIGHFTLLFCTERTAKHVQRFQTDAQGHCSLHLTFCVWWCF